MEVVLKNSRVVDPLNNIDDIIDIAIEGGKIAAVKEGLSGKEVIDCGGRTIIPGVIDTHVHVTARLGGHVGYYMCAKDGVTTIIDFAGPIQDIVENAARIGCGLNVGCLDAIDPDKIGKDPSRAEIDRYIEQSMEWGAIGTKILGGHFPLTPNASRETIQSVNARRGIVAFHAGSTNKGSDIEGFCEAVELAKGSRLLMAHVNSYCRGRINPCIEEMQLAFQKLRENPNVLSDSYLSIMNGTPGICKDGLVHSAVTVNCLKTFGYGNTEKDLGQSILDGITRVVVPVEKENLLMDKKEGYDFWCKRNTDTSLAFPVNSPTVAVGCAVERRAQGGEFLIPITATDGGGFPRNEVIERLLALYRLGYLTLNEVAIKSSLNASKVFGLKNKGHLSVGADADITVLNEDLTTAVMSYANGKLIMKDKVVVGSGAKLITTEAGKAAAAKNNLPCIIPDLENSAFYKGF